MHLSLRLAFARTDCTPHDTLCTYGAKQLRFQGFYMVDSTGLEPVTPCTSRAVRSYFSVF